MDAHELLRKVRQIEIKTRGLSQNIFAGEYHSAFKGRGVTFSEVREYQDGDEIRISTGYGEKAATLTRGGVKSNVFNAVDVDSTWMQLHPGDNLLRYSADDTSGLAVTIYYDSYFLGV